MELTKLQIETLSNYFDHQAHLPSDVRDIATSMRNIVHPAAVVGEKVVVKKVVKKTTKK